MMDVLDAEREQILIEKAKLETLERLKPTATPTVKRQTELDAAIQIAQVNLFFTSTGSFDTCKSTTLTLNYSNLFSRMLRKVQILNAVNLWNSNDNAK